MVRKGYPMFKLGFFALIIILFVYISPIIPLSYTNAIAAQMIDDALEGQNGSENDNYKNATAINPGEHIGLKCLDDDWYKVNVPDLGEIIKANLKVTIQFSHMNGDLDLNLYSAKTPPTYYNFLDISGLTANEEVVSASIPPGDYLIRVYGYKDVKNDYTMNVEILYPCQYFPYEWMDINDGKQAISLKDDDYQEIEIGFDFEFYGQVYDRVNVSSNGYLTFAEPTNPSFDPISPIPISATRRNAPPISIFSYWMNLRPDLGGGVFYKIDQSNPNCKKLIVEWRDVPRDPSNKDEGVTFQTILLECTNQILIQYEDVMFSSQNDGYSLGSGATVGITNGRKTPNSVNRIATQYLYKKPLLTEAVALMFTPSLDEPLRILSSNLIDGDIQAPHLDQQINILFCQYLDNDTLNGSISIDPSVNGEWVVNQNRIIFNHQENSFAQGSLYKVTLFTHLIRDCFGNALFGDTDYTFSFIADFPDTKQPDIEVSPTSYSFGNVLVTYTSPPLEIGIFNKGNAELTISSLSLSDGVNFSFNLTDGSNPLGNLPATIPVGENRTVAIMFHPSYENKFISPLTINSNDKDSPILVISLDGEGILTPEPDIKVSPNDLSFGNVRLGRSSILFLTIFNIGNIDLNISELSLSDLENFSFDEMGGPNPLGNLPATIPPGENRLITLSFTPSVEKAFNEILEIASDDPDTPRIDISIQGIGLTPPEGWTTYDLENCLGSGDCLTSPIITAFMLDANETLWIGSVTYEGDDINGGGGICAYDMYTGDFSCFDENDGLAGNRVIDIAIGPQGELWVATDADIHGHGAGVSRFTGSTGAGMFESYNATQMGTYDDLWITDIAIDNNSHLWVATQLFGLLEFDGLDWAHYTSAGDHITSLNVDSSGRLWIGTLYNGLFVKEPFGTPIRINFNLGEYISEIATDPTGNLWIVSIFGNENSLSFLTPDTFLPIPISLPDSLADNDITYINDLFIHPNTGNLFIASDIGFYEYNGQDWNHFNLTNSSLPSLYVNSIMVDPYNDYWVGTEEGLSHFNSASPYIIGEVYGDTGRSDDLPRDTSIFVNFSEPMDRESTKDAFEMRKKGSNSTVKGLHYWNKNSTVIKFEPSSSLAYNSKYEVRIYAEARDLAGMNIDLTICDGTEYCSFIISTKDRPKEKPSSTSQTGSLNYYWPNFNFPNLTGYFTGTNLLRAPNDNINLKFNVNPYSSYRFMSVPQTQSIPFSNFNTWNLSSTPYYIRDTYQARTPQTYRPSDVYKTYGLSNIYQTYKPSDIYQAYRPQTYRPSDVYKSYGPSNTYQTYRTSDIYQSYRTSIQGLNNYTNFYQNR